MLEGGQALQYLCHLTWRILIAVNSSRGFAFPILCCEFIKVQQQRLSEIGRQGA